MCQKCIKEIDNFHIVISDPEFKSLLSLTEFRVEDRIVCSDSSLGTIESESQFNLFVEFVTELGSRLEH